MFGWCVDSCFSFLAYLLRSKQWLFFDEQQALGLAALKVQVLEAVIEACVLARLAFLAMHPDAPVFSKGVRPQVPQLSSSNAYGGIQPVPEHLNSGHGEAGYDQRVAAGLHHGQAKTDAERTSNGFGTESGYEDNVVVKREDVGTVITKLEDDDEVYIKVEEQDDAPDGSEGDDDDVVFKLEEDKDDVMRNVPDDSIVPYTYLRKFIQAIDIWIAKLHDIESGDSGWTDVFGNTAASDAQSLLQPKSEY